MAALILAILPGCSRGNLRVLISQDHVLLIVGDSARPQWAVVSGKDYSLLSPSLLQYDNFGSPDRFRWYSSDPTVATVDGRGTIRALVPGQASVTATSQGLTSPPLRITVQGLLQTAPVLD